MNIELRPPSRQSILGFYIQWGANDPIFNHVPLRGNDPHNVTNFHGDPCDCPDEACWQFYGKKKSQPQKFTDPPEYQDLNVSIAGVNFCNFDYATHGSDQHWNPAPAMNGSFVIPWTLQSGWRKTNAYDGGKLWEGGNVIRDYGQQTITVACSAGSNNPDRIIVDAGITAFVSDRYNYKLCRNLYNSNLVTCYDQSDTGLYPYFVGGTATVTPSTTLFTGHCAH